MTRGTRGDALAALAIATLPHSLACSYLRSPNLFGSISFPLQSVRF